MAVRTAKCKVNVAKRFPKEGAQRGTTQGGAAGAPKDRALTPVVGQPLVAPPLELVAVEFRALLRPEVAGALGTALWGGGGLWVHQWGPPSPCCSFGEAGSAPLQGPWVNEAKVSFQAAG